MIPVNEKCIPCFGEGKLRTFQDAVPKHVCPWCEGAGVVHPEVNKVFLRVDRALPNIGKFCVVFGAGNLPPEIRKPSAKKA